MKLWVGARKARGGTRRVNMAMRARLERGVERKKKLGSGVGLRVNQTARPGTIWCNRH